MGYEIEELLKYESAFAKTRDALNYLYVAHYCHNGDKELMMETLKFNLSLVNTERAISSTIEAIKILKRNLRIKIGIKTTKTK
jgi:hypothetical protein